MFLKGFKYIFFALAFSIFANSLLAKVTTRTSEPSAISTNQPFYASMDFSTSPGFHFSAPEGKGKEMAPKITWENAEVMEVFWPEAIEELDQDGSASGFYAYNSSMSILFKLKITDKTKPVKYDATYVVCGNGSCIPRLEAGELNFNGELSKEEISSIIQEKETHDIDMNFLLMLALGFIGGIILNCMPCVFPIISMKIFTILKSSESERSHIRKHGISFSLGIISVFIILGLILLTLKKAAPEIGWGSHMQEPIFVYAILLVFLLCGLHFFGIFNLHMPTLKRITLPIQNEFIASFFSGIFGGVASSACVGPFVGVALAGALLYGQFYQSISIFTSIGLGLALPFILISIFPGFISKFPKPGSWLESFKQFMGFAMLFSCVWPIWILLSQTRHATVIATIVCIISVSMFIWLISAAKNSRAIRVIAAAGAITSVLIGGYTITKSEELQTTLLWRNYSDELFDNAKIDKTPIFLNFTASWCLNCQFNHRLFEDPEIIAEFKEKNVTAIKCDWTNRDLRITELMQSYGSVAVPLYVYYPGNNKDFIILPTILTKSVLLNALRGETYDR